MFFIQRDEIEIPQKLAAQEAVLQEIRNSFARPLVLRQDNHMHPIEAANPAPTKTRAEVVPFKKRESPPPPKRPAPAVPLRPAAIIAKEMTAKLDARMGGTYGIRKLSGDELIKLVR